MQQDRDRNGAFLRSNIYEDRPRHTYSTPGTSVQDLKAPRYGNRSVRGIYDLSGDLSLNLNIVTSLIRRGLSPPNFEEEGSLGKYRP